MTKYTPLVLDQAFEGNLPVAVTEVDVSIWFDSDMFQRIVDGIYQFHFAVRNICAIYCKHFVKRLNQIRTAFVDSCRRPNGF